MITPDELVQREVIYCVSTLIYELRDVADSLDDYDTYLTLTGGKPDYEEAATYFIEQDADEDQLAEILEHFGVEPEPDEDLAGSALAAAEEDYEWVCNEYRLEPEYGEIYEHWIVSNWLGRKLTEHGQVVEEFMGMTIWGRQTTGQMISIDWVIEQICKEMNES